MPKKPQRINSIAAAKITRPQRPGAFRREHLLARLDSLDSAPLIWISGPPGSGKTTLVSTWRGCRQHPGPWFQVDTDDADPARLFFCLREAVAAAGLHRSTELPLLSSEYARDISGFARRWFRCLFAMLRPGETLTLDNFQELPADSPLHAALAAAVEEISVTGQLVIVSWTAPSQDFARLAVNQRLVEIDWNALKILRNEISGLAADLRIDQSAIDELADRCGGWIAGFTLLSQRAHTAADPVNCGGALQRIFDYFIAQVFSDASPAQRDLMVKLAPLPAFTISMAARFGDPTVARELFESLARRHLFVDRHPGPEVTYQYHGLFKAFLEMQATIVYTERGLFELWRDLAHMLRETGQIEAAIDLYLKASDWQSARDLILQQAPRLYATGQGKTLKTWIAAIPDRGDLTSAWLRYWVAASMIGHEPRQAQSTFSAVHTRFVELGDPSGQLLAAVGFIEAVLVAWVDLSPGLPWLAVVENLLTDDVHFPSLETEARVCGVVMDFAFWTSPGHSLLPRCASRVLELLDEPLEVNQKLMTASYAIEYFGTMGFAVQSRRVIAAVKNEIDNPQLTKFSRISFRVRESFYLGYFGQYAEVESGMLKLELEALANGLAFLLAPVYMRLSEIALARGDDFRALEMNDRRRRHLGWVETPAMVSSIEARVAACRGEFERAIRCVEAAVSDVRRRSFVIVESLYLSQKAIIYIVRGELLAARDLCESILQLAPQSVTRMTEVRVLGALAWIEAEAGDVRRSRKLLEDCLRKARESEFTALARMTLLDRWLCTRALAVGVETSYVRRIVSNMGLLPEFPDAANWPWPIRVMTLGRFEICRDDLPLEHGRKAPQKLLTLLASIIAGGGRPVSLHRLADEHWPDEEADAAHKALSVALHRLRKLLGSETAIVVQEGQIVLNDRHCWVDAFAFLGLVGRADDALKMGNRPDSESLAERAIELYRGCYLDECGTTPRIILFTDRLRNSFLQMIERTATRLIETGEVYAAQALCEKAIAADPLAESAYRAIMQCHIQSGRFAEGLATYRRLRQVLSIVLGITPSSESEKLYQLLVTRVTQDKPASGDVT